MTDAPEQPKAPPDGPLPPPHPPRIAVKPQHAPRRNTHHTPARNRARAPTAVHALHGHAEPEK